MPNQPAIPLVNPRLDKTLPGHEYAARRTRAQAIKKLPAVPGRSHRPKSPKIGQPKSEGRPT